MTDRQDSSWTQLERRALEKRAASDAEAAWQDGALIVCDRLVRIYAAGGIEVQALRGLDLLITEGELTALVGASGSGKSTLLNILAGVDRPTAGTARVAGFDLLGMGRAERVRFRRETVGFVRQSAAANLLPFLTAEQNVVLPMRLRGRGTTPRSRQLSRAGELLRMLDVAECSRRRPEQMSGGQQQRVAIAVALANAPRVVFADEPTGQLDTTHAEEIFAALRTINQELGVTVVIVTHDATVSEQVRRTVAIRDGRIGTEVLRSTETDEHGQQTTVSAEYAVLDRSGLVQLPKEHLERLHMRDRVRLALEADHIGVWPDRPAPSDETAPGRQE